MAPNTSEPEFEQVSHISNRSYLTLLHLLTLPPSHPPLQARDEIYSTLKPFFEKHPEYKRAWEVVQIPERVIQFR